MSTGKTKSVSCKALPKHEIMVKNIESVFAISDYNDILWYRRAHQTMLDMAEVVNRSVSVVCAVAAVLSPSIYWAHNVDMALSVILDFNDNNVLLGNYVAYPDNLIKAEKILATDDVSYLGGNKVISFYNNLLHPNRLDNTVTVDRHATAIVLYGIDAINKRSGALVPTSKAYGDIAQAYNSAGLKLGLQGKQIQAATWCMVHNSEWRIEK